MNFKSKHDVKLLQDKVKAVFNNDDGKDVMKFLEEYCGWYQSIFSDQNRDMILINDGRRQVVATIKTFLKHDVEKIMLLAKREGL